MTFLAKEAVHPPGAEGSQDEAVWGTLRDPEVGQDPDQRQDIPGQGLPHRRSKLARLPRNLSPCKLDHLLCEQTLVATQVGEDQQVGETIVEHMSPGRLPRPGTPQPRDRPGVEQALED